MLYNNNLQIKKKFFLKISLKEKEISSSELDPKPDLNRNKNLQVLKKLKLKQKTENKKIIIQEHITYFAWIIFVKIPVRLQRDKTQIQKVQNQECT